MKAELTFAIGTSRSLKQVRRDYKGAEVTETEEGQFHITMPIDVDEADPLQSVLDHAKETGDDEIITECFQLTIIDPPASYTGELSLTEENLEE